MGSYPVVKRIFSFVTAAVLLILCAPLFGIIALLILITMGSPIFFTQIRPGLNEKPFAMYKFRTMSNKRDADGKLLSDQERLNFVGKALRCCSIDELPQLINVLKGEMCLIGPRPQLVSYRRKMSPEQRKRHTIKPGITGWAQVNGRNNTSWDERFEHDLYYVNNMGPWLDLKILVRTVVIVLGMQDTTTPGHATMAPFEKSEKKNKRRLKFLQESRKNRAHYRITPAFFALFFTLTRTLKVCT